MKFIMKLIGSILGLPKFKEIELKLGAEQGFKEAERKFKEADLKFKEADRGFKEADRELEADREFKEADRKLEAERKLKVKRKKKDRIFVKTVIYMMGNIVETVMTLIRVKSKPKKK